MVPTGVTLRGFRSSDLAELAALLQPAIPVHLLTPAGVGHFIAVETAEMAASFTVATSEDRIVGWSEALLFPDGSGWLLVVVAPEHRRRGIGTALVESAWPFFSEAGVGSVSTFAIDGSPGEPFVERLGFTRDDPEVWLSVDPREVGAGSATDGDRSGMRLVSLGEVWDRAPEIYDLYLYFHSERSPEADVRAEHPYDTWVAQRLRHPNLEPRGSFVALSPDDVIVSMSWLHTDPGSRLAETDKTITHPEWRGRGLARATKIASLEWAAGAGFEKVMTSNKPGSPAHHLNESLGYRQDATSHDWTVSTSDLARHVPIS